MNLSPGWSLVAATRWRNSFNNTTIVHRGTPIFHEFTPRGSRARSDRAFTFDPPRYRVRHSRDSSRRPSGRRDSTRNREARFSRDQLGSHLVNRETRFILITRRDSKETRETTTDDPLAETTTLAVSANAWPASARNRLTRVRTAPRLLPSGAERDSGYHPKVIPPGPPCATAWACQPAYLPISLRFLSFPLYPQPRYRTTTWSVYLANAELARAFPESTDDPLFEFYRGTNYLGGKENYYTFSFSNTLIVSYNDNENLNIRGLITSV